MNASEHDHSGAGHSSCCGGHGHGHHGHDEGKPSADAAYYCPMCHGMESDKPGDCPQCGMALERNPARKPAPMTVYTCPMHPEVRQDHPGDCPKCGMALEPVSVTDEVKDDGELRDMTRRFRISAALTLPVFLLAMAHLIPSTALQSWADGTVSRWVQFAFSTPVIAWAAWPFFRRGWKSIVTGNLNMFTLIAIGVGAAYLFSAAAMVAPGLFPHTMRHGGNVPVYFEAAAVIVVLVLLGQVLELRARSRTGSAIRALLDLAPPTARRVESGGDREVPLDEVRVGDRLRVVPGDRIPVDGEVVEGSSNVEESMITGEPVPVEKAAGAKVTGGTLNGSGSFIMSAERVGDETLLGQIVQMVAVAQRSRAPIQALADKVAAIFVPVVLAISVITFVLWFWLGPEPQLAHAIVNAVAVLIIACPCALGLATPMSIMVGVGRGAGDGVLVKNAEALERLEKADTLVVDKTGTLTEGRPAITAIHPGVGVDATELLQHVAALEQSSEHPLAGAILQSARDRGIILPSAEDFRAFPGGGIGGRVSGHTMLVGKAGFLRTEGVEGLPELEFMAEAFQNAGGTAVFAAIDGRAAGLLVIEDPVKPSTPGAIRELQEMGLRVVMLTGDHRRTAAAVAARLGITDVVAEVDPADKARQIRNLRDQGRRPVMAGDGINDAPALGEAEVGIAMGGGTDVAMQSAGITLMHGDLRGIAKAIRLSRAVMRNIRENLLFAFIYNAAGIPVAAGILYPLTGTLLSPIIAGAAMSLSSVSVITNALRLRNAPLH